MALHAAIASHNSRKAVHPISAYTLAVADHFDTVFDLVDLIDRGLPAGQLYTIDCGKGLSVWQLGAVVPLEPVFLVVVTIQLLKCPQVVYFDTISDQIA